MESERFCLAFTAHLENKEAAKSRVHSRLFERILLQLVVDPR
jgi:hypothetical protein